LGGFFKGGFKLCREPAGICVGSETIHMSSSYSVCYYLVSYKYGARVTYICTTTTAVVHVRSLQSLGNVVGYGGLGFFKGNFEFLGVFKGGF